MLNSAYEESLEPTKWTLCKTVPRRLFETGASWAGAPFYRTEVDPQTLPQKGALLECVLTNALGEESPLIPDKPMENPTTSFGSPKKSSELPQNTFTSLWSTVQRILATRPEFAAEVCLAFVEDGTANPIVSLRLETLILCPARCCSNLVTKNSAQCTQIDCLLPPTIVRISSA